MQIELWTDEYPLVFDGLVLEVFSTQGYRWHVCQIESMSLETDRKGNQRLRIMAGRYGGMSGQVLPETSVATFWQVADAIDAVRAERYGWGPIERTT